MPASSRQPRTHTRKIPGSELDAPKNYTPHLSELSSEGRRNQPRNSSPKKMKKIHSQEHVAEVERKKEFGVLEKFTP